MPTILIADDEKNIRQTLARALRLEGYATREAENGADALQQLEAGDVDLVILDLEMPVLDGLALLETMAERGLSTPSLVLTAHGSIEKAVRAVRLGAFDFIEKPPAIERILLAVSHALRVGHLEEENLRLTQAAGLGGGLLGESAPMLALAETVRRVAPTSASVLLLGENGTGKELVARAIHAASPRKDKPLVTVNCAAIPETLFESELFGHARGSFTGATEARRGKFQQADGGTLFLDEIGEVPLSLQPKMLRALESGEVERVGGQGTERVNARVIAATNRNLEAEVASGRFRQDLYYRLLVVPLRVPPLRERREDIPLLARHHLEAACGRNRIRPKRLSDEAIAILSRNDWPGNVRELRNAMERLAILVPGEVVGAPHLGFLALEAVQPEARGMNPARSSIEGDRGRGTPITTGGSAGLGRDPEPHRSVNPSESPGLIPGRESIVGRVSEVGRDSAGGREPLHASGSGSKESPRREGETGGRLPAGPAAPHGPFDLAAELQNVERALVLEVLERNHWQMSKSAQELNLERSHLYKKLKALGIERPSEE